MVFNEGNTVPTVARAPAVLAPANNVRLDNLVMDWLNLYLLKSSTQELECID